MVQDHIAEREFFIDNRIGTNTRGQTFETVKGQRFPIPDGDLDYVRELMQRAIDHVLATPNAREWQIKKRYYSMVEEILNDALKVLG